MTIRLALAGVALLVALACQSVPIVAEASEPLERVGSPVSPPAPSEDSGSTEYFLATPTIQLDVPPLTLDRLRNFEYRLQVNAGQLAIPLRGGLYEQGSGPGSPGYLVASMNDLVAYGDLNADRVEDAVVLLAVNQGGTGMDVHVAAVINAGGIARFGDSVFIDDRAIIQSIRVDSGKIIVDAIVHGPNDPGCCPSTQITRIFRLVDQTLVEQQ